jgi:oligosaccharide repeat unit polymerase
VLFVARPIAMIVTDSFELETYHIASGFNPMLTMALLGGLGFVLGYAVPWGRALARRLTPLPPTWHADTALSYSLIVAAVGLVLFAIFLMQSGGLSVLQSLLAGRNAENPDYATSSGYLYLGIFLSLPAALFIIASGDTSPRLRGTLIVLGVAVLSLSLVQAGPSGTRSWLVPIFGSIFIFWYIRRGRRPRARTLILLVLVGFTVGITFAREARNLTTRQEAGLGELLTRSITRPGDAWDSFILGPDTEMAALLALETQTVPSPIPHTYGTATAHVFVHPIPRLLWEGKPRPGDEILTRELFFEPRINFAPRQYSPLANFYMDFGYAGVFAGMAVLGLLARTHYAYFTLNATNPAVQIFYAATLPFWVVMLRGSISDTSARLFFVIPPLLFGFYLARRRRPDAAREPAAAMHAGGRRTLPRKGRTP